jgi:hypothetical protein
MHNFLELKVARNSSNSNEDSSRTWRFIIASYQEILGHHRQVHGDKPKWAITGGDLKVFLENVIRDAVTYTEHVKRKTVTAMKARPCTVSEEGLIYDETRNVMKVFLEIN